MTCPLYMVCLRKGSQVFPKHLLFMKFLIPLQLKNCLATFSKKKIEEMNKPRLDFDWAMDATYNEIDKILWVSSL